jgi:hypothetical protein
MINAYNQKNYYDFGLNLGNALEKLLIGSNNLESENSSILVLEECKSP